MAEYEDKNMKISVILYTLIGTETALLNKGLC